MVEPEPDVKTDAWQLRTTVQPSRDLSLDDVWELGLSRVKILRLCHSASEMVWTDTWT